ncbi:hypothetical protein CY34DRAFT_807952 [Suillus luteus UH-Slu-Lm8-n1]|uniref:Uncharacterized protein n=1 Tax=Suillus luteus UH-Slu-Lm8-n1 TaxID=930992 RepID=A0A0C9ZPV3_9AGAM|nr:hypothetical protein CY34DRAFT_807952 [Suillus luteus UH-Slu-Lm8-n1]
MDLEVKTHFELENEFCIRGHHADGLRQPPSINPMTTATKGASALSPLLFLHQELQAALVTQSKGASSEGPK